MPGFGSCPIQHVPAKARTTSRRTGAPISCSASLRCRPPTPQPPKTDTSASGTASPTRTSTSTTMPCTSTMRTPAPRLSRLASSPGWHPNPLDRPRCRMCRRLWCPIVRTGCFVGRWLKSADGTPLRGGRASIGSSTATHLADRHRQALWAEQPARFRRLSHRPRLVTSASSVPAAGHRRAGLARPPRARAAAATSNWLAPSGCPAYPADSLAVTASQAVIGGASCHAARESAVRQAAASAWHSPGGKEQRLDWRCILTVCVSLPTAKLAFGTGPGWPRERWHSHDLW